MYITIVAQEVVLLLPQAHTGLSPRFFFLRRLFLPPRALGSRVADMRLLSECTPLSVTPAFPSLGGLADPGRLPARYLDFTSSSPDAWEFRDV